MTVPRRLRLASGLTSGLGALPAVFDGFGTNLGMSRFQVPSARCRGTRMLHRFRARGLRRILGLKRAVSGRFGMRLLCRGPVNLIPFLMHLGFGPVSTFCMSLAAVSLRCRRRFLWTPLELF